MAAIDPKRVDAVERRHPAGLVDLLDLPHQRQERAEHVVGADAFILAKIAQQAVEILEDVAVDEVVRDGVDLHDLRIAHAASPASRGPSSEASVSWFSAAPSSAA